jgi:hypothetical protein
VRGKFLGIVVAANIRKRPTGNYYFTTSRVRLKNYLFIDTKSSQFKKDLSAGAFQLMPEGLSIMVSINVEKQI